MTAQDKLRAWADRVARLHQTVEALATDFGDIAAPPLQGVPPQSAAAVLVDVWKVLGLPDPGSGVDVPAEVKAKVLASLQPALDAVPYAYSRIGAELDAALGRLAASTDQLIRTADFSSLLFHNAEQQALLLRQTVLGPLSALPPGHRLCTLLPTDDYYVSGNAGPCLVLGLAKPVAARSWYWRDSAARLTRAWRAKQRQQDAEHQAIEEREKLDRQRRWEESPQGREAELRKRIAALEAQLATTGGGG